MLEETGFHHDPCLKHPRVEHTPRLEHHHRLILVELVELVELAGLVYLAHHLVSAASARFWGALGLQGRSVRVLVPEGPRRKLDQVEPKEGQIRVRCHQLSAVVDKVQGQGQTRVRCPRVDEIRDDQEKT
jgi:hypothetical protein